MKILEVIPHYTWSHGGPVRGLFELSNELETMGHDVTIFTTSVGEEGDRPNGGKAETRYFNCLSNRLSDRLSLHISREMRNAIKYELKAYDVVHLNEWRAIPNDYIRIYSKMYGVPYIMAAHGSSPLKYGKQGIVRTLSKMTFDATIGKAIIRGASKFIALNPVEVSQYEKFGISARDIEIVPNGINTNSFKDLPEWGSFRNKYNVSDSTKIVLFLGRLSAIKSINMLIEAFYLMGEKGTSKLVIVGPDYGVLSNLRKLVNRLKIQDRVIFTGPLFGRDRLSAYVDADVFVLPSSYDAFPNAVLEASACGKPVIVTDRCGIAEMVRHIGVVVPYDKKDISVAIDSLLSDDALREKLGKEAARIVVQEYDWAHIAKRIEAIYRDVCL